MNATHRPTMKRLATGLGAAALTAAAALSLGAATATANPPVCTCTNGEHLHLGPQVSAFSQSSGGDVSAFVHELQRRERSGTGAP